jgi:hypothetical protein
MNPPGTFERMLGQGGATVHVSLLSYSRLIGTANGRALTPEKGRRSRGCSRRKVRNLPTSKASGGTRKLD